MATTTALVRTPASNSNASTALARTSSPTTNTTLTHTRTPTTRPTASTSQISPSVDHPPALPSYPPSPGTWRHPKFTEIARRRCASTFSDRNLLRAVLNVLVLFLSFFFTSSIHTGTNYLTSFLPNLLSPSTTTFYTLNTIRLYLLYNIADALSPLFPNLRPKDNITDIPLTPSQRYLLGLDPSIPSDLPDTPKTSASASTNASPYITPPRYRRSSSSTFFNNNSSPLPAATTPTTTDRRSISATYYSSSPLSTSRNFSPSSALSPFRSPSRGTGNDTGNPFSPLASPLLQKAIAAKNKYTTNNNGETADIDRRRSLGTPSSGLGRSQSLRERGARAGGDAEPEIDSPSPAGRMRLNPSLNYKWLYEKGARLPKSETMQF